MHEAASAESLAPAGDIKTSTSPSGARMHELVSDSRDGTLKFAQFSTVGPRTVLLVTLECGSAQSESIATVRAAVAGVRWLDANSD
jgi:hypothetical protein